MARRKDSGSGGHGWFVTFADLMGAARQLLRDAGRVLDPGPARSCRSSPAPCVRRSACRPRALFRRHRDGWPADAAQAEERRRIPPEEASERRRRTARAASNLRRQDENDRNFALAAASLRQALQDMPEITEISKHIIIEETKEGLNIEIVDQDGRSMFPEGAKEPYERTRR